MDFRRIEVVHPRVAAALRAKAGVERLRLAHETWELTRDRLTAFLSARHPEWDAQHVRTEVGKRLSRESG